MPKCGVLSLLVVENGVGDVEWDSGARVNEERVGLLTVGGGTEKFKGKHIKNREANGVNIV